MTTSVVALVPMRHESERVPRKNYREFAGRPLYHHIVESLLDCPAVTRVVIDTDSDHIAADAAERFPGVELVERPVHLRGGDVPMNEVLIHDVGEVPGDLYLQTHSTNPLLRSETIGAAIDAFIGSMPRYDSLFSVTRVQKRFWTQDGTPINHDPAVLLNTQDLPAILEENSCLYLFSRQTLVERRNRIGQRPMLFGISAEEAWDIDEEVDFAVAEFLHARRVAAQV